MQTLYFEYAAHHVPVVLQSRYMTIDTGLPAKPEEKSVTVTRRKPRKSKAVLRKVNSSIVKTQILSSLDIKVQKGGKRTG